MAFGDSLSAGAFSHGLQHNILSSFAEYRGESFANGADPGAITIHNLIKKHNPNVTGGSIGKDGFIELCYGPLCPSGSKGWNATVDQLNASQSGALASNLPHEARDYLVPQVQARNIPASTFKYLNIQVGSNDQCTLCSQAALGFGPGTPDSFESTNTIVNVVGVLKVSDVYIITQDEYCEVISGLPHLNIECECMLLPGPIGDATRSLMDKTRDQYNERLIKIVKDYQAAHYPDFAVTWQPAAFDLARYPAKGELLDCFHPSLQTHQLTAAEIWNRLPGSDAERGVLQPWIEKPTFRCLKEDDRIQMSALL
ncbi:hypothetical protein CPB86DRAFT_813744 [Serendipita vermifera]|nr:hypothetical protein CPB86DRAFT_813744 [Serendipita vermifera]